MKLKLITVLGFFLSLISYSQVGIGTTLPDSSSILDLTSTSQGLLAPRMTSVQRLAIASPAEGLLVFDTDQDAFYYYDTTYTTWIKLQGSITRDNYKLVKSIADLSDELIAGGGSTYQLNANYLYEINGAITFDYPVNLNGAYIEGRDTGSDILINASGATLFSGSAGGHLKNLRIEAGGQQLFNLSGSGAEGLVCYTLIVNNASSLGSVNNFYLTFFEILQVVNSNNGLSASNITSFFMDKTFWTASNTGTFLTLSGTFGNLQIANGRAIIDTGEVGVDVTANPTIINAASMTGLSYTGTGNYVDGYSIGNYSDYNFTNDWFVQCQGVLQESDEVSTGSVYMTVPAVTSISAANTPVKVAGTTTSYGLFRTAAPVSNRLVYIGRKTRYFQYTASISVTASSNNKRFNFYIAKNGVIVAASRQGRKISTGTDIGSISVAGLIQLQTNDYIEVWVENIDDATDVRIEELNLIIK